VRSVLRIAHGGGARQVSRSGAEGGRRGQIQESLPRGRERQSSTIALKAKTKWCGVYRSTEAGVPGAGERSTRNRRLVRAEVGGCLAVLLCDRRRMRHPWLEMWPWVARLGPDRRPHGSRPR